MFMLSEVVYRKGQIIKEQKSVRDRNSEEMEIGSRALLHQTGNEGGHKTRYTGDNKAKNDGPSPTQLR